MESLYPSIETILAFGVTIGVVVLIVIVVAVSSFLQKKRKSKDKEDFPEKLMVSLGDSFYMTLERRWFQGQWVYIYFGKPPYAHRSPSEEERELESPKRLRDKSRKQLEIPECLKGTPEEDTLRRFDELTKPGGVMDEVIIEAYNTPKEIERQKLRERIREIVKEKSVVT